MWEKCLLSVNIINDTAVLCYLIERSVLMLSQVSKTYIFAPSLPKYVNKTAI